jgi:hypothetical protein
MVATLSTPVFSDCRIVQKETRLLGEVGKQDEGFGFVIGSRRQNGMVARGMVAEDNFGG